MNIILNEPETIQNFDVIEVVEKWLEKAKLARSMFIINKLNGQKKMNDGRVEYSRIETYSKEFTPETPEEFLKVEKKLDTQKVNQYLKEHNELPRGIVEVLKSTRYAMKEVKVKEELPEIDCNQSEDFSQRFKLLAKKK